MSAPNARARLVLLVVDVWSFVFWHIVFGIHCIEAKCSEWWWNIKMKRLLK